MFAEKFNTNYISNGEICISKQQQYLVPIWEKSYLTLEEAAAYSGIGINKIRDISNMEDCPFVLWNGTKRLLKRRLLDEYFDSQYSI